MVIVTVTPRTIIRSSHHSLKLGLHTVVTLNIHTLLYYYSLLSFLLYFINILYYYLLLSFLLYFVIFRIFVYITFQHAHARWFIYSSTFLHIPLHIFYSSIISSIPSHPDKHQSHRGLPLTLQQLQTLILWDWTLRKGGPWHYPYPSLPPSPIPILWFPITFPKAFLTWV